MQLGCNTVRPSLTRAVRTGCQCTLAARSRRARPSQFVVWAVPRAGACVTVAGSRASRRGSHGPGDAGRERAKTKKGRNW